MAASGSTIRHRWTARTTLVGLRLKTLCAPLLNIPSITMTSPVGPLAKLRCHCINFSRFADHVACALANSQDLDWNDARSLALTQNLNLGFASETVRMGDEES
ncbi:hypothetical protein PSPO01_16212 [Paraphaeosphaeria sporulosa]